VRPPVEAARTGARSRSKVALFSTDFLKYSQTFIYDEVQEHTRYSVEVFCRVRMNASRFPFHPVHSLSPARNAGQLWESLQYGITTLSPSFKRRLQSGGFDLLHAHFGPGGVYALPYQKSLNIPLIVTFHGYDVPLLQSRRRYLPRYLRYTVRSGALFQRAARLLAASGELKDMLVEVGAPPEKVHIWRLGVRIPSIPSPRPGNGRRILMIGRFVEKKGFEYGIQAFAQVLREGIDAELTIVGGGPRGKRYRNLTRTLGIRDRVRFSGILSPKQVFALLGESDVLLAPSVVARDGNRESGLLVAKEAAAFGLPVIGTKHGGIPEIIDHEVTGFLVPERSPQDMADKLAFLLRNPSLATRMGREARAKMLREYDIQERIAALERHYDAACEQAGKDAVQAEDKPA